MDSNDKVLNNIKKLNSRNGAKTINTFDFSTLYTKIPHEKLLEVLNELIDFCFKGGTHDLIAITSRYARWTSKKKHLNVVFHKELIKEAINYLMHNCHFTFGKTLFKQIIGIPMGSDPAPYFANLFLYHFESKWTKSLKKIDTIRARKFCNTFRFIDDLFTINDGGEFLNYFQEIYPPELQLNHEHAGDEVNFLDLSIRKSNGRLDYKLYDKRDAFPFSIVRLPFSNSNIPNSMFYASFGAEVLRIGRVSSSLDNFLSALQPLIRRMVKQGGQLRKIRQQLQKVYGRQPILKSFGQNAADFCDNVLH